MKKAEPFSEYLDFQNIFVDEQFSVGTKGRAYKQVMKHMKHDCKLDRVHNLISLGVFEYLAATIGR